ncbi:MAG: hypothetical protein ABGW97_15880 [Christiangramia sp.]|uniref:hypothetical protein n=1 Tax=Christiangramia sp. TaxID=1931228 RepID=UPI003242B052
MNKPRKLPVKGITVLDDVNLLYSKSFQSKRGKFIGSIESVLKGTSSLPPQVSFEEGIIQGASVLVFSPLSDDALRKLINLADSWNLELMLGVVGDFYSSIKIEFNLKSDK